MEEVIRVMNLKKIYNPSSAYPKVALENLSMTIHAGTFTCIMGPSGSGKTTLINILSTIDDKTSGEVILLGREVGGVSPKEKALIRKKDIGFIFQDYNLIDSLTMQDNILFSMRLNKVAIEKQKEELEKITIDLGIQDILDKYPYECSGGQMQRVAIARALITRPSIIFADEPTGNLDSLRTKELMQLFTKVNIEYHSTIIMVSHDCLVASYSTKMYYVEDGKIKDCIERGALNQMEYYSKIANIAMEITL